MRPDRKPAGRAPEAARRSAWGFFAGGLARHDDAHLGRRTVLVVRQTLHEKSNTAGAVTLIHDGLVIDSVSAQSSTTLNCSVNIVVGDTCFFGLLNGVGECRIPRDIGAAHFGGNLNVFDELCERLCAPCINDSLLVLRCRPF